MSYASRGGRGLAAVLESRCRHLRPARYDDRVRSRPASSSSGRASVRFGYRVLRTESGELLAVGFTEHCYLGPDGRPVRPHPRCRSCSAAHPA